MATTHKIIKGYVFEIKTDGTYKNLGKATPEQIAEFNAAEAKRKAASEAAAKTPPTASKTKSTGTKKSSGSKSSGNKTLYGDPEARQILIDAGIDPDIAKNPITVGRQSSTSINKWTNDAERQAWERRNPSYVARWKSINPGVDFDPGNKEHIKDFEDYHWAYSYNGIYNRLQKQHPDWSDEELEKKAKKAADQISFAGKVDVDVNAPDQKWGNWHRNMQELKFDDDNTPAPEDTPVAEEETQAAHIDDEYQLPDYAPWWLQDQIAIAGDVLDLFRIKKYTPWQARPDTDFVEPTFYDPTRELAANAEAANLATQTAQAFTNPQQAIAATLAAQAQAARANADVLGRYNSMNVDAANQAENVNTQIYNQASLNRAQQATQLYDKYTIANQQFDNSKNMARQKLRQDYINAITNRQNTYNLNTLYPQYAVDPARGGPRIFRNPRDLDPKAKTEKDLTKAYQEALAIPNTTPEVALQLAKNKLGIQDRDYTNPNGYYTGPYGSMEPFKYPGWTPQQNEE